MLARLHKPAAWRDRRPVRSMTSGARNRPPSVTLSVTLNNKRTCSVYGVGGTRLKKIENRAANANCAALPTTAVATVYFGAVEVRNWQVPGPEVVLTYPSPAVKLTNGVASYLHRDHLGSVRAITDAAGARVESAVYKPFGEQTEFVTPGLAAPESKGWIGQRYDADAGLQYLNARYYDPVLGMFLQPDWFEVLQPGVGANRFSYSFNDPVNLSDPLGNCSGNGCKDASVSKSTGKYSEKPHNGYARHEGGVYSKLSGGNRLSGVQSVQGQITPSYRRVSVGPQNFDNLGALVEVPGVGYVPSEIAKSKAYGTTSVVFDPTIGRVIDEGSLSGLVVAPREVLNTDKPSLSSPGYNSAYSGAVGLGKVIRDANPTNSYGVVSLDGAIVDVYTKHSMFVGSGTVKVGGTLFDGAVSLSYERVDPFSSPVSRTTYELRGGSYTVTNSQPVSVTGFLADQLGISN
jgi:RHS repeat-associated protein